MEGVSGFTYGSPAEKVLWAVRFEAQDTNEKAPLLEDDEVEYVIGRNIPGVSPAASPANIGEYLLLYAAAHCMEVIAGRFAAVADRYAGVVRIAASKRAESYMKAAQIKRKRAAGMHAPWSGGMGEPEKESYEQETNAVQPFFRRKEWAIPYINTVTPEGAAAPQPLSAGESEA